jgi:hypothetical protein
MLVFGKQNCFFAFKKYHIFSSSIYFWFKISLIQYTLSYLLFLNISCLLRVSVNNKKNCFWFTSLLIYASAIQKKQKKTTWNLQHFYCSSFSARYETSQILKYVSAVTKLYFVCRWKCSKIINIKQSSSCRRSIKYQAELRQQKNPSKR